MQISKKADVYNPKCMCMSYNDMYVLNRVAGNTKIVQGRTFVPTNNYDLSYLKQPKSNPSLSLLVKSFKYD